jgi:hypothetical protein
LGASQFFPNDNTTSLFCSFGRNSLVERLSPSRTQADITIELYFVLVNKILSAQHGPNRQRLSNFQAASMSWRPTGGMSIIFYICRELPTLPCPAQQQM